MAKAKRKKRQQRAERLHREPVVRRIAELLATGTPTPWRFTSEARHGLRAGFCLKGMQWEAADKQAAAIVVLARHRIGLSHFPTWSVAQGNPREEREFWFCAACGGFMKAHNRPWCSEECRNVLYLRTRNAARRLDDAARESAVRVILTGGAEVSTHWQQAQRRCHRCRDLYTPTRVDQRYCSRACSTNAARYPSRPCLVCAAPFGPKRDTQLHCSVACKDEAIRRRRAKIYRVCCHTCGVTFTAHDSRKIYCSRACKSRASEQVRKAERARLREAAMAAD